MLDKNPVLFYFWTHSEMEELWTQTLTDLLRRANVLFIESVSSSAQELEMLEKVERACNAYSFYLILDGLVEFKDYVKEGTTLSFLLQLTKGEGKRYVFERTLETDFDYEKRLEEANRAFTDHNLSTALEMQRDFLIESEGYNTERMDSVAEQILGIPNTILVLFGAGHPELDERVSQKRPTEIYYPYLDYPLSYDCQMRQKFRETGEIDKELYLRARMEEIALFCLKTKLNRCGQVLVAHHYAGILTPDQIIGFRDYVLSCLGTEKENEDPLEAYLDRESLPSVSKVLEEIR